MSNQTSYSMITSASRSNEVPQKEQQQATTARLVQQLYNNIQKSETFIVSQMWMRSLEAALCSQVSRRKQVQKIEFLTNWALLCLLAITATHTALYNASSHIHTTAFLYIEVSLFTRILAYSVDFANAREKLGKLPAWLILHHVGVFATHITVAFYFSRSYFMTMIYLISIQSTHNTWTKKYSLALYWGNVLLGVITSIYVSYMNALQDEVSLSLVPCICILVSLLTTFTGIGLLVVDCQQGKKTGKKQS